MKQAEYKGEIYSIEAVYVYDEYISIYKGELLETEAIKVPLSEVKILPMHDVSKRVFCFLYSDGNEIYNKSAISETRTEARKIIEDKHPNLFLLRDEQSYDNVC